MNCGSNVTVILCSHCEEYKIIELKGIQLFTTCSGSWGEREGRGGRGLGGLNKNTESYVPALRVNDLQKAKCHSNSFKGTLQSSKI